MDISKQQKDLMKETLMAGQMCCTCGRTRQRKQAGGEVGCPLGIEEGDSEGPEYGWLLGIEKGERDGDGVGTFVSTPAGTNDG
eukprot:1374041-Ditylum_brightwellii.AAC.1